VLVIKILLRSILRIYTVLIESLKIKDFVIITAVEKHKNIRVLFLTTHDYGQY